MWVLQGCGICSLIPFQFRFEESEASAVSYFSIALNAILFRNLTSGIVCKFNFSYILPELRNCLSVPVGNYLRKQHKASRYQTYWEVQNCAYLLPKRLQLGDIACRATTPVIPNACIPYPYYDGICVSSMLQLRALARRYRKTTSLSAVSLFTVCGACNLATRFA